MSSTNEYSYKGEWTDALQSKLKQWFASQSDFLTEMEFETSLFEDFITVMVKEKRRTMGEIQQELEELQVDQPRAAELCESLAKLLKSAENSSNPLLGRALQTSRGSVPKAEVQAAATTAPSDKMGSALKTSRDGGVEKKEPTSSHSNVRLLNVALHGSRGDASRTVRNDQRGKRRDDTHFEQSDESSKKFRSNDAHRDRRGHDVTFAPPPPNSPPPSVPLGPEADTIKYFERMNELAQKSGFKNAQEMLASQQQVMAMMQGAAPASPKTAHHYHPHMPPMPPGPMMPHSEPQRFDYFPQQHYQPYPGYEPYGGYGADPRFHGGSGFQGRGAGRGAGRGRGRFGNKEYHAQPKPAVESGDNVKSQTQPDTTAAGQDTAPAAPAPTPAPPTTVPLLQPATSTESAQQQPNRPFGGRGGGRESFGGRGGGRESFGGRFQGGRGNFGGRGAVVNAHNPFAAQSTDAQNAAATSVTTTTPESGAFGTSSAFVGNAPQFGSGFGGGRFGGRGRGRESASSANKVWVRKTDAQ